MKTQENSYDVIIGGGGIVGLASGLSLLEKNPSLRVLILEKELQIAQHQTGNNSGVIHSGIYYKPGSLKAINCQNGYHQLIKFASENEIPFEICGKVIVATEEGELPSLDNIYKRGIANGLSGIKILSAEETKELEPHVMSIRSIFVPQTGIIDYKKVAEKYKQLIEQKGGKVFTGVEIDGLKESENEVVVSSSATDYYSSFFVNACGLQSDKITKLSMRESTAAIIPFRGEYYELEPSKEYLVKNLIYPVPNPDFPFLGVHFTRMINGGIEAGPNAVLAFAREGYSRKDLNLKDLAETLMFPGFRKMASKYWREGMHELYRSWSKRAFCQALQRLIPEIEMKDIKPANAGIRAQACLRDGTLVDDFLIYENPKVLNIINAPSPAATASLSIGNHIAQRLIAKIT